MNRREMKAQARHQLRRQYWMIVVICLFAAFFGVEYSSSMWGINFDLSSFTVTQPGKGWTDSNLSDVFRDFLLGKEDVARKRVEFNQEQIVRTDTNAMFGRSRGLFASLLNSFSSGAVIVSIADATRSIVHDAQNRSHRTGHGFDGRILIRLAVHPTDIPHRDASHAA